MHVSFSLVQALHDGKKPPVPCPKKFARCMFPCCFRKSTPLMLEKSEDGVVLRKKRKPGQKGLSCSPPAHCISLTLPIVQCLNKYIYILILIQFHSLVMHVPLLKGRRKQRGTKVKKTKSARVVPEVDDAEVRCVAFPKQQRVGRHTYIQHTCTCKRV